MKKRTVSPVYNFKHKSGHYYVQTKQIKNAPWGNIMAHFGTKKEAEDFANLRKHFYPKEFIRVISGSKQKRNPDIHIDIGSHNATKSRKVRTNPARRFIVSLRYGVGNKKQKKSKIIANTPHSAAVKFLTINFPQSQVFPLREERAENTGGKLFSVWSAGTDYTGQRIYIKEQISEFDTSNISKNPEPAKLRRKHTSYQVQRSNDGKRWIKLADFPHNAEGKALAIQYAKAYHAQKRAMVRVIE